MFLKSVMPRSAKMTPLFPIFIFENSHIGQLIILINEIINADEKFYIYYNDRI